MSGADFEIKVLKIYFWSFVTVVVGLIVYLVLR